MTPEHTQDLLRMYAAEAGAPWQRGYYWRGDMLYRAVDEEAMFFVLPPASVDTMHGALMAHLSGHNIMVSSDGDVWVAWRILLGDAGCPRYSRMSPPCATPHHAALEALKHMEHDS